MFCRRDHTNVATCDIVGNALRSLPLAANKKRDDWRRRDHHGHSVERVRHHAGGRCET